MAEAQQAPARKGEIPKYRITETCYLNERLYEPESMPFDQMADQLEDGTQPRKPLIVAFGGVPAYYMVPMNDAAKAMCEKHKDRMTAMGSPIDALTMVTTDPVKA